MASTGCAIKQPYQRYPRWGHGSSVVIRDSPLSQYAHNNQASRGTQSLRLGA